MPTRPWTPRYRVTERQSPLLSAGFSEAHAETYSLPPRISTDQNRKTVGTLACERENWRPKRWSSHASAVYTLG
jgi:hypothetical protein